MSQTFSCPNCTANLEHDGGNHLTIKCPFCNSTVIVPEELRPRAHRQDFAPLLTQQAALQTVVRLINMNDMAAAIQTYKDAFAVNNETAADAVRRLAAGLSLANQHTYTVQIGDQAETVRRGGCLITGIIGLVVLGIVAAVIVPLIGGVAALLAFLPGFEERATSVNVPEIISVVPTSAAFDVDAVLTSVADEFAVAESLAEQTESDVTRGQVFAIGERGIGPGQFNDARVVAVSSEGTIYVADRDSGRLQTFAPDGTYQTTLPWEKEKFTDDLEIGPDGNLYAQQSGHVYRYEAASAQPLGEIVYSQESGASSGQLALTINGDILAITLFGDGLVRFDAEGNVLQNISMDSVPSALDFDNVAVDGLGNIYVIGAAEDVLGDRQNVVFKFTAEGQFASQFGSNGNEPGLFMGSVSAIAVDGQGRIYVGDFQGIQIFDNNGRFLDLIPIQGAARDIALTNQGELVTITSQDKLYKFDLSVFGN